MHSGNARKLHLGKVWFWRWLFTSTQHHNTKNNWLDNTFHITSYKETQTGLLDGYKSTHNIRLKDTDHTH